MSLGTRGYLKIRRVIEIILVLIFGPLIALAIFAISLCILLTERQPAFYRQSRIGKHGRYFTMYKFRTMYLNVDSHYLTRENDSRITPLGKILRRYKLDELPQFFNVLMGDMSLVGPRPVPANFYDLYRGAINAYDQRHEVAPGITGLAQVTLGYTQTLEEEAQKLHIDLYYIEHLSLRMDIKILISTMWRNKRTQWRHLSTTAKT